MESSKPLTKNRMPPTAFELMMNYRCDMHMDLGIEPPPHWQKTRETPNWTKKIYQNFFKTILKPLLKLRPKRKVNWRYFGRIIGILERFKTFWMHDVEAILKAEGLDKISEAKWARIQPLLGEKLAREYYLKVLKLPAASIIGDCCLVEMMLLKQFLAMEKMKQNAFFLIISQDAKTTALFLQGMREGYTAVLNANGEFSADDRRASIHFELLAWQYDIEKMRRSVPQKYNKHLIVELKKLPEFKNKADSWFNEVFKDITLAIGKKGCPPAYCGT